MVSKLLGTIGVPGTFSGKMYSIAGLRYWPQVMPFAAVGAAPAWVCGIHAPSITARTSRGGGRNVLLAFMTRALSGLAGRGPNGAQGGRERRRPGTRPLGGPWATAVGRWSR